MRQAVILAGGFGTRLAAVYGDSPKPMVPLLGRPVLDHLIDLCRRHGFDDILILAHHRWEAIRAHVDPSVRVHVEAMPMGTAGALSDARHLLADRFLVLYGDTYADVDLSRMWNDHAASGADATLFTHPNSHPHDSDLVEADTDGWVRAIHGYPHQAEVRNLVNAALYVMEKALVERIALDVSRRPDIAKHLFPAALDAGMRLRSYRSVEYVKDMGTPDRLARVEADIRKGVPERLSGRTGRQAVFLDRDGTLNEENGLIRDPDALSLIPGAALAVQRLNQGGWLSIVATNQPVIARGEVSETGLERIHARLDHLLGVDGAYLDVIRYCPHHPDSGFPGEVAALKVPCGCRKPEPGLLTDAIRDFGIDPARSWMVGDATTDIEAGRRAGVKTILVRTGWAGRDGKSAIEPDYVAMDLAGAVEWITGGHAATRALLEPLVPGIEAGALVLVAGLARSGKSGLATVLRDVCSESGRTAHVICLDGWLKPEQDRPEGAGVEARFDLAAAAAFVRTILDCDTRCLFDIPLYDRATKRTDLRKQRLDWSPGDVLIVEGVPALLSSDLVSWARMRIYVDIPDDIRNQRLQSDYQWRGMEPEAVDALIASRNADERPATEASMSYSTHIIRPIASA